jgi:hypothetical protein
MHYAATDREDGFAAREKPADRKNTMKWNA